MATRVEDYARHWGSTPQERALDYACDAHLADPGETYFRAIDVDAPPAVLFRWLCQLKVAPYSYDWLDNFGRRSPRELRPGLERLEVGQRFMTIFDLVDFEEGREITLAVRRLQPLFGEAVVTYVVLPRGTGSSRLLVKLLLGRRGPAPVRWLAHHAFPVLELVMMRKQLRTLKALAERSR